MGGRPQRTTVRGRACRDASPPPKDEHPGENGSAASARAGAGSSSDDRDGASTGARSVLLLGVGNILYGDEGLGVYVVHRIRRTYSIPPDLRIIDCGALGWHIVPYLQQARRAIVVDAVAAPLGSIYRYTHHDVPEGVRHAKLSSEELQLPELLATVEAQGDLPPTRIVAMGVEPGKRDDALGVGLSSGIEARLPALELLLLAELSDAGIHLRPRTRVAAGGEPRPALRHAGRRRA